MSIAIAVYEEIKDLPNHPEKTLIDVRSLDELKRTGVIPTSINIPRKFCRIRNFPKSKSKPSSLFSSAVAEVVDALNLSDDQFKEKYDRTKPSKTSEVIFSCQLGGRAGRAAAAAVDLGYEK